MITQGSDIKLVLNIADMNGIYDLVGATVSVRITKPSKQQEEIYCDIIDIINAKVEAQLDKTLLNEYGNYSFQAIVKKGNSTNISPSNGFYVGQTLGNTI